MTITQLPVVAAACMIHHRDQQALRINSTQESSFYDAPIKSYYVYMGLYGEPRFLRFSPVTFDLYVTQASFKYVRVHKNKTYRMTPI